MKLRPGPISDLDSISVRCNLSAGDFKISQGVSVQKSVTTTDVHGRDSPGIMKWEKP